MNRRNFLKTFISTTAAISTVGAGAVSALPNPSVKKNNLALQYQAIGRKLLYIDGLPQGALARYERDVKTVTNYLNS